MDDSERRRREETILHVFDELDTPGEPLSTSEVAAAVDDDRRTVYGTLTDLAERDVIETKQIGARARAWWRPRSATDERSMMAQSGESPTRVPDHEERGLVEQILEASPVGIVVVEPSGEITLANERAEETLGLERDEITTRTYRQPEWNIYYDDGTPVTEDEHPVTRVLESEEPVYGFEHWIELPDGTERWLSSNSAPVLNDDGELEYVVVGFEDVTPLKDREDKLTSDKRRLLELYSEQLFAPFFEVAEGEVRIEVDEVVTLPDGTALQYITASGIPTKALVEVFEAHVAVLEVRLLRSSETTSSVEIHVEGSTVPLVFDELGGEVTALVSTDTRDAPVLTGELPGDVDPRTAIRAARDVYPDIELESQELRYSPRLLYDIVEDALTDRQFAALQAAYYGGYFDSPRTSTGKELAARLGITRQTFNQHLRKAEQAVLEQLFESSGKGAR